MQTYKFVLGLFLLLLWGCHTEEDAIARPYAFHRIDLPEKVYERYQADCPFTFEVLRGARVVQAQGASNNCWLNVEYPQLNAKIHLTYGTFTSRDGLGKYINDAHRMTYKHTVKASSIEEIALSRPDQRVFGFYFRVGGNAASSSQFYLTDSSQHFLRGAVYFESEARADSLEPLINYMRADLEHLLETFRWQ
jgi:gliding motility-associated lipoprotein GldD